MFHRLDRDTIYIQPPKVKHRKKERFDFSEDPEGLLNLQFDVSIHNLV